MLFGNRACRIQGRATRSERLSPLLRQHKPVDIGGPLEGEEAVNTSFFDCSAKTDDALRYASYFVFGRLHSLGLNCNLYSEGR